MHFQIVLVTMKDAGSNGKISEQKLIFAKEILLYHNVEIYGITGADISREITYTASRYLNSA